METLQLWPASRLDIAVKVLFARLHLGQISEPENSKPEQLSIREIYRQHILLRTGGIEPGSPDKNSIEKYEAMFIALIDDMASHGFREASAIPVNPDKLLLNGAHRISAALALGIRQIPTIIQTTQPFYRWDMHWFLQHGFSAKALNLLIKCWMDIKAEEAGVLLLHTQNDITEITNKIASLALIVAWRDLWLPAGTLSHIPHESIRIIWIEANSNLRATICAKIIAQYSATTISPMTNNDIESLLDEDRIDACQKGKINPSTLSVSEEWAHKNLNPNGRT